MSGKAKSVKSRVCRGGAGVSGRIGIGIIGCGTMGEIHARAYSGISGCRIVGFTNRTRSKSEALAGTFGGRVFDDAESLLADPEIHAVSICSSQQVHAEQIILAARHGKHVLCEKPLALTSAELDAVARAVRRAGITFAVAHQLRFHPVVRSVIAAMPRLGRCYHLDLEMCFRIAGHEGRCWQDLRSGGFFMELGVHLADLARHLMGEVDHVAGCTLRLDPKRVTEDYTNCLLHFANNSVGSLLVSANHRTRRQGLLFGRLLGERGQIEFTIYPYQRSLNQARLTLDKGKSVFVPDTVERNLRVERPRSIFKTFPGFFDVYQRQATAFLAAVRDPAANPPPVSLEDGRKAVEIVLAAYHSQSSVARRPNFRYPASTQFNSDPDSHPLLMG